MEPRWPRVTAAVAFAAVMPAAIIGFFALGIAGSYGLGLAFGRTGGSLFGGALSFGGVIAALIGYWAYRRAVRGLAAALRRRLFRTGKVSPGKIRCIRLEHRHNPRGPDRIVVIVTVWFPADRDDPRQSSREIAALNRYVSFFGRDLDDAFAYRDRYPTGTPVQVYLGRRRILYSTDLDPTRFAWYQFW